MIVLIDTKTQNILLYKETGLVKVPFSEAVDIFEFIGNKKVTYVTNAMNVSANDIIELINSLGIKTMSSAEMSSNKYLRGIYDGTIYLREGLKFEGKCDCKIIDKRMKGLLQTDDLLKKLISTGKIEIIGEVAKRRLDKENKKLTAKKVVDQQAVDARLDSIIMDGRVDDWDGTINVNDHSDAVEIDVGGESKTDIGGGASVETMSELIEQMDG